MFRARGPLRPRQFRRLMRAGALLVGRPRQQLSEAHSLESEGQFQAAAQQFAELSDKAADYGMLDRAGNLSLQAARAYLEASDTQQALAHARSGLSRLMQAGREWRAGNLLEKFTAALRERNLNVEADALEKEFAHVYETPWAPGGEPAAPRGHLPSKCPNCGGPLHSDETDWIDQTTAECPYCGTPVRAE